MKCPKRYVHDWRSCPFAHPTENARRRDPRDVRYMPVPCPDYKRGLCLMVLSCCLPLNPLSTQKSYNFFGFMTSVSNLAHSCCCTITTKALHVDCHVLCLSTPSPHMVTLCLSSHNICNLQLVNPKLSCGHALLSMQSIHLQF